MPENIENQQGLDETLKQVQGDSTTVEPTAEPTTEPTAEPTVEPTAEPTTEPTAEPTVEPTAEPKNDKENNNDSDGQNIAPEEYDFKDLKLPEGFEIDKKLLEKFAPVGKKLNLSQEQANDLANLLVEFQQEQLADAPNKIAEYKKQEKEATRLSYEKLLNEDVEIGKGDKSKMDAYLDVADVGYKNFATPELKNVLQELSLDYHPAVIKLFHKLGELCGNDSITTVNKPAVIKQDIADILYSSNSEEKSSNN